MSVIEVEATSSSRNAVATARRGKSLSNKKVQFLVVGLGASGLSCVRYLMALDKTVKVVDSRLNPPAANVEELKKKWPDVELSLGDFNFSDFASAEEIVVSPGVPMQTAEIQLALKKGITCYGDIELFARHAKAPIIAVTGSNGKSTTVTLLTELLREDGIKVELGGNIGIPALDLLTKKVPDYYVLELSSFQLETTSKLKAFAAIVLNVSADHMDRYESLQDYSDSKTKIFSSAKYVMYNIDDEAIASIASKLGTKITYSMKSTKVDVCLSELNNEIWIKCKNELIIKVNELKIAGSHNIENVLATLALALSANVSKQAMINTLRSFAGLAHRTQWLLEKDQVRWYNDSKGTNIGATNAALQGLPQPIVLIAGGQAKGADFSELRPAISEHARAVVLIGEDAKKIEEALQACVPIVHAMSMDEAVLKAASYAQPGDAVLLSPACASFDMFKNFIDRGESYIDSVKRLIGE